MAFDFDSGIWSEYGDDSDHDKVLYFLPKYFPTK